MKAYNAIILYMDFTFEAKGFDDPDEARRWVDHANRRSVRVIFRAYVLDAVRHEAVYVVE